MYFSDRELGPRPRTEEEISTRVWGGLVALISKLISVDAFGADSPYNCPDGLGISGTDTSILQLTVVAELPDLPWPLQAGDIPSTLTVLDLIEFCHRYVAKPIRGTYHSFFDHYHLSFNREEGQSEFRQSINLIFSRNSVAYSLETNGEVIRIGPPVLREALATIQFNTGDVELNAMLEAARAKYLSPDPSTRRESLEKLWDAWERIKTIEPAPDKKASVNCLLDKAASEANFRKVLEIEALELTRIGNTFRIRHSETTQIPLESNVYIDYLFHRLFAIIQLLLKFR